eukprot:TRINITY_DN27744_c0_g1_i1.p1 TRINITY_DN27744_c0_g1~~TRINITY_DN27744_c0_g1_i1.p1  ORF type:complete len:178 (+),score=70.46 TRINITY_DN27744_c0_g1_i1:40-534(+)
MHAVSLCLLGLVGVGLAGDVSVLEMLRKLHNEVEATDNENVFKITLPEHKDAAGAPRVVTAELTQGSFLLRTEWSLEGDQTQKYEVVNDFNNNNRFVKVVAMVDRSDDSVSRVSFSLVLVQHLMYARGDSPQLHPIMYIVANSMHQFKKAVTAWQGKFNELQNA